MKKIFLLGLLYTCLIANINAQIDIAVARTQAAGTTVTVQGIATHGGELGIIRYIQDATGGIAAYPGTGSQTGFANVAKGDLVQVTGVLKNYNNLLEIDPITAYTIVSSNNAVPTPLTVTPNGVGEANEAILVKVEQATFSAAGGVFAVGNFTFTANGETSQIYLRSGHPLIGTQIPLASVNITGVVSQFNALYQLLPRLADDIQIASTFFLTSNPEETNIISSGFDVTWGTNANSTTTLRYGLAPDMLTNTLTGSANTTNHTVQVSGLQPATVYYVQAESNNGTTTVTSNIEIFCTASLSSGNINILFNKGVDGTFAEGAYPITDSPSEIENAIIHRINQAQTSIDVAMFNTDRVPFVQALEAAHMRGVRVRYVTDVNSFNEALSNPTPSFNILGGNDAALMHNKFYVIDANSVGAWVMMGSLNMTDVNVGSDYNNMVFIQDQSLAKAYQLEFEEMWGSSTATPGIFASRFGSTKTDNTPHRFNINGIVMESYFSPSDATTNHIVNAVESADSDLQFGLLTFTMNSLGTAVVDASNADVNVRGLIDNINDQGSEFPYLTDNGIDVREHTPTGSLHHKYAIIDATNDNSDPTVVTGSHNWSNAAETVNDENTLIIHNKDIANIFLQEFEARWCEVTGGANCTTATNYVQEIDGFSVQLSPNPAATTINAQFTLATQQNVLVNIFTLDGKRLQATLLPNIQGETVRQIDVSSLAVGQYIVSFSVNGKATARQLSVVR
ncbi:MAG: T9SS type A sorting domain-containing protein [Saprospiraceae bacterium]|nr:T9SS type A sorting domain-containing protein [Saprospiraceae bacterium]MBP7699432.1 T9SS type A sorting domain-containing protein [Saprospiraceae bacterium]